MVINYNKLTLIDFKLFDKSVPIGTNEVLQKNILFTNEITLTHYQNFFSFEFTALNYRQSEKNHYKYIMEGLRDEWVDIGTERKISFTNLSPGEYVFRVIASNNDGVWNMEGTSVRITIMRIIVIVIIVSTTSLFSISMLLPVLLVVFMTPMLRFVVIIVRPMTSITTTTTRVTMTVVTMPAAAAVSFFGITSSFFMCFV